MKRYKDKLQESQQYLGDAKKIPAHIEITKDFKYLYIFGTTGDILLDWLSSGNPTVFTDINNDVVIARDKKAFRDAEKVRVKSELGDF